MRNKQSFLIVTSIFLSFMMAGCIWIYRSVEIDTVKPEVDTESPFKAHLHDGRIAIFPDGATFGESIKGTGRLYSTDLQDYEPVFQLDDDDIAAYSVFRQEHDDTKSFLVSAGATAATVAVTPFLLVAIFGSCPTVYTSEEDSAILRGELFSNSIAPMLEARDLISVVSKKSVSNTLRLEIRNEALETHYFNHLELIEIEHEPDSYIVPTSQNQVLSLSNFIYPNSAYSKSGHDLTPLFESYPSDNDSDSYTFDQWPNIEATHEPAWDHIDLVFPPLAEETALHLKLKNTLFSTVLLYDFYLSGQGVNALDWIGKDLGTVSEAIALGGFHNTYMGMRVQQHLEGEFKQISRVSNVGPVSWKDLGIPIKPAGEDSVKIRLTFLADSWKIQSARLAASVSEPEIKILPPSGIVDSESNSIPRLSNIIAADNDYLITQPGQRFFIEFPTSQPKEDSDYSYLLAGQGYYTEWIRSDWMSDNIFPEGIEYNSDLIVDAQNRWIEVKTDLEERFFNSKVPVK